ncbi:MAG: autotransporter outer membrane beta-barrel domain-containing protein [Paracoccaceae bacterium]
MTRTPALLLAGASALALMAAPQMALADCTLDMGPGSGNVPPSGATVTCADNLDTQGISAPASSGVTVRIESPSGGISTTGAAGILLGADATIDVTSEQGSNRPVTTQGDAAPGIDVTDGAAITVAGQVRTAGEDSPGIRTGADAQITVTATGTVATGGGTSAGIVLGDDGSLTVEGEGGDVGGRVRTGNSNSAAVLMTGEGGSLTVQSGALVTTSSGQSNPVLVEGDDGTVEVSGDVRSSAGNATAILGTADGLRVTVADGGFVTAQSSGSDAIASEGEGARITVEAGGEVAISSGNSIAIVAGQGGRVRIGGTVSASSSDSAGVALGDDAQLRIRNRGVIETSSSESQAVRIGPDAETATVIVARGGRIDAVGAQSIVDRGETDTEVTIDGVVFGGSSDPILDMRAGDDVVTVNGTVRATSASPVIALGAGNDTLNNNSSQTIEGPGRLVSGGGGDDTLNLSNGTENSTSDYSGFETTTVGRNRNEGDPNEGGETQLTVDSDQSGNTIEANDGGRVDIPDGQTAGSVNVNASEGGTVGVTADNDAGTGSGQGGATITTEEGATVEVASNNGGTESQTVTGADFDEGSNVTVSNSDLLEGTAGSDRIDIAVGEGVFGRAAARRGGNAGALAGAMDRAIADDPGILNDAFAAGELDLRVTNEEAADLLARLSGEGAAQAALGGVRAVLSFNEALAPGGGVGAMAAGPGVTMSSQGAGNGFGSGLTGWAAIYGGRGDVETGLGAPFESDSRGLAVGVERAMPLGGFADGVAGVALGYATTDTLGDTGAGEADSLAIGAYFAGSNGPLEMEAALSFGRVDAEAGDLSTDGTVLTGRVEAAYDVVADTALTFGPMARLSFTEARFDEVDGFSAIPVQLDDGRLSQRTLGVGVRAASDIDGGGRVSADLLYERVYGDDAFTFDGLVGSAGFTTGVSTGDDERIRLGLAIEAPVADGVTVGARYDGLFADTGDSHSASLLVTYQF